MANATVRPAHGIEVRPWMVAGGLLLVATVLSLQKISAALPPGLWARAFFAPDASDGQQLVIHYSLLPRILAAILAGAALALAGAVFQQVLRNPLASPTTLGVSAGAKLALALATLWAPGLFTFGREWVALAGGAFAVSLVFALSWHKGLSPLAVVLAGLVLGLYCGSVSAALILFREHYLTGLFIWGSGSLSQQGWDVVSALALQCAVTAALIALMIRPLTLLSLEEAGAASLGVSLQGTRLMALGLAVALTGFVVSGIGVIGFIGLISPALARLSGARRLRDQFAWAPAIGAGLLWTTDQLVLRTGGLTGGLIPTGAVTALFGSPLLLWLLPRLRNPTPPTRHEPIHAVARSRSQMLRLLALGLALAGALVLSLLLGRTPDGEWALARGDELSALMPWRAPRAVAALIAGAMLAVAGAILQRMTRNPMASPEVLGVGAGAALGLIVVLFTLTSAGRGVQVAAACTGAFSVLFLILVVGRRSGFTPERVLLAGIAIGALFDALVGALTASGDPRGLLLLNWMTGSTYQVDELQAAWCVAGAVILLAMAPLCGRWLDMMPLGDAPGQALGLDLGRVRLTLLALAAGLTAIATLVVGPLTFVGLMAPHLATRIGLRRALPQLGGAALVGALLMLVADWLGRMIAFPWQMPAGLIATLIGGPALIWLLARK
ncbi:iron complex transport system permease protein [Azorhizobium sp. AG788]|uniref:Fe(3+)-hydroxamate ABC transporter permease FhuB n=1 Tax=Azorhizobium sp. AG788 TaxID=2183897 RepID=UPI00106177A5|nr:Fe(3+)-hydroxamate ABC transporter permease FhuB [Azorhizobium sp. AG788]TDT93704.1 iron complex transport system permease protein [Azorhizobium sp. AG788]